MRARIDAGKSMGEARAVYRFSGADEVDRKITRAGYIFFHFPPVAEGRLVIEQHIAIRHREHIIMECARVDGIRVLLNKHGFSRLDPVQPGNGLARFQ